MVNKRISASLEDYLETIYEIVTEKQAVRAIDISKNLNVGKSSVTEALKSLTQKNLINYEPYSLITLTEEGRVQAEKIVYKHNVLFDFLNSTLNIEEEEAKENACKIEHVISENVLNKLVSLLEFSKNKTFIEEFKKHCDKKQLTEIVLK